MKEFAICTKFFWIINSFLVIRTLLGHKGNVKCVDFHPYGDFIASGSSDSNIKVSKEINVL